MTDKLDLKKTDKTYYGGKPGEWARVTIPPCRYLSVSGQGAPEDAAYAAAMERLYPVAYGVKFAKKAEGRDFVVPPLSTQWWADDPSAFGEGRRDEWHWQALIRMPDFVEASDVGKAAEEKGVTGVSLINLIEGECFQTVHIGPYSDEGPTLVRLHEEVMPEAQVTFGQPHHEIYLSDPRRAAPEKLRTVIRQPVVPL
ncbi:GyrI-like domain-containing protein [Maritimibacter sp. DP1N21-5]|uniref:GyrI-like domain-containing protein n=1 Tax=Maritimibacter sp. DP1N21-5 TaxID=2836867 RepID=UPI001C438317|nr:GyrI-like domain-containing protein [Maritimibacter sp. DP1N21-5]MBV7408388.1 GyrI-like domain-containing protein [Maritimibacter sp. DP1N21-5]